MVLQCPVLKEALNLIPTADTVATVLSFRPSSAVSCTDPQNWLARTPRNLCCILLYAGSQKPELMLEQMLIRLNTS